MKKFSGCLVLVIVTVVILVLTGTLFIVNETQQAVVLQLGKPIRVIVGNRTDDELAALQEWMDANAPDVSLTEGAGLYVKVPFLQQVSILDDRVLEYDDDPADVVTRDKKHIQADCYARWRIQNPLLFLQSVRTEREALDRLDDVIYSELRQELGKSDLINIVRSANDPVGLNSYVQLVNSMTLSDSTRDIIMADGEVVEIIPMLRVPAGEGREVILNRVTENSRRLASQYGIHIVDIRIKRADLPAENQAAVFSRMQAERNRISTRYRAEGHRMARTILAETDLKVDSISSQAQRLALSIQGRADSTAAAIYAQAYQAYPEFYRFTRSLEALESVIDTTDTAILSTEGVFNLLLSTPGRFQD
jgi:membrane protease subunit HflC